MYQHSVITQNAKSFQKANRGITISAAVVIGLCTGLFNIVQQRINAVEGESSSWALVVLAISFIGLLYSILVAFPVAIGGQGWFLQAVRGNVQPISGIFDVFKGGMYSTAVCTQLLLTIYTFLWSLLFIVPGIIKGLSYSMAGYIINDNPNLTASQALELSSKITEGHKADLFYLNLTILGWSLLGILTCGILNIVFAMPYAHCVQAMAYETLKTEAVNLGKASAYEFGDDDSYNQFNSQNNNPYYK